MSIPTRDELAAAAGVPTGNGDRGRRLWAVRAEAPGDQAQLQALIG